MMIATVVEAAGAEEKVMGSGVGGVVSDNVFTLEVALYDPSPVTFVPRTL
jgi:hypothetical protein